METDIRIANGAVSEIKAKLKHRPGEIEIDASGLWILPGSSICTRTFATSDSPIENDHYGHKSCSAGGYTTVVAMANTDPPTDSALVMGRIRELIERYACVQVLLCVRNQRHGRQRTD